MPSLIIGGPPGLPIRFNEPFYAVFIAAFGPGAPATSAVLSYSGDSIPGLTFTLIPLTGTAVLAGLPSVPGGSYSFAINAIDPASGLTGSLPYAGVKVGLGINPIVGTLLPVLPLLPVRQHFSAMGGSSPYQFKSTDATGSERALPYSLNLTSDGWMTGVTGFNVNSRVLDAVTIYITVTDATGIVTTKEYLLPSLFSS